MNLEMNAAYFRVSHFSHSNECSTTKPQLCVIFMARILHAIAIERIYHSVAREFMETVRFWGEPFWNSPQDFGNINI